MTYFECIKQRCEEHAKLPGARFIGYNTSFGSRMYGTLTDINPDVCIEAPVAENLMCGLAMGIALEGYRPVICFERHDFMLLALDGLVNHLDKLPYMSGDQFKLPVIVRAIVGASKPINPGPMHTANYSMALRNMFKHTPVLMPMNEHEFKTAWKLAGESPSGAVVIIEHKDLYNQQIEN